MQKVTFGLRRFRFLIGVIVLLAANLILATLLWRELQATQFAIAPPPEGAPALETLSLPASSATPSPTVTPADSPAVLPTNPAPTAMLPAPATETPPASPSATLAVTPTPQPTEPSPATAVVVSSIGLRIRDAPSGAQIGSLSDGDVVTLLPGREMVQGTVWQQVRADDGREGWVSAEFLEHREE